MAREVLVECARAASRQRDSYLAAQFWRLARRIGKKKAALAVEHSILVIAWHLPHNQTNYTDLGADSWSGRPTTPTAATALGSSSPRGL